MFIGTPSLTSTHTNGATPEEHLNHPHPLSNGNSHVSNSHSPIPQATHVASNGGTPSGDATQRASGDTPHIAQSHSQVIKIEICDCIVRAALGQRSHKLHA